MRIKLFISVLILCSCSGKDYKEYRYIEKFMKTNGLSSAPADQTPIIITAVSDSDAYLKAYLNFCVSHKVYKREFEKSGTIAGKPISFKLLNENSKDIAPTISFLNKDILEKEIERKVSRIQFKN